MRPQSSCTYEIRLGAQPEADVVVKLSSLDQKVIPVPSFVRFNSSDWSEPKTMYIVSDVEFGFGEVDLMGYEGILHQVEIGGQLASSDCVDIQTEVCSGHTCF